MRSSKPELTVLSEFDWYVLCAAMCGCYVQLENLLADIGGQFGLWAGLSVLGFIEVFDFLGQFLLMLMGVIKRKFN